MSKSTAEGGARLYRKVMKTIQSARRGDWGEIAEKFARRLKPLATVGMEAAALLRDAFTQLVAKIKFSAGRDREGFQSLRMIASVEGRGKRKNLVWIMLDALREDIFREYLQRRGFPSLQPYAYFGRAFVQGSWTYPSVFSFLTARYPYNCGVSRVEFDHGLPISYCADFDDSVPTIFDLLRAEGYQVGSILDGWGFTVRTTAGQSHREDRYFEDRWGWFYGQGKRFLSLEQQRSASLSFLEEHAGRSPFVLFLRSLYTHSPYRDLFPSPEYVTFLSKRGWRFRLVEGFIRGLRTFEEQYMDSIVASLKQANAAEDTVIVICSDHGEMLWDLEADLRTKSTAEDEEKWRHQLEPYNALIRVPLMISGANMRGYRAGRFRLIDLVPTLLDEMNVSYDADLFDGISLGKEHPRPIYADSAGYGYGGVAFQLDGAKLLSSRRLGACAYPIDSGEFERLPLRRTATLEVEDLRQFLAETRRGEIQPSSDGQHERTLERRLQDLGYIE